VIWAGLGLVMATTFYEAAFAVIEIGFGAAYRKGITVLTFAGGLASTVFIPITQWLVNAYGWRGAAIGLAVANLVVCVPLHALLPARTGKRGAPGDSAPDQINDKDAPASAVKPHEAPRVSAPAAIRRALASLNFWTLVIAYTGYALVIGTLGVHLIPLLGAKGFSTGEVVLIASMVGPMQVAGRLAQYGLGDALEVRRLSRIVFAMLPVAMGVLLLAPAQSLFIGFFVVFYGVGMGISTILRGTAMPELFGRDNYAALSNLLSAPSVAARAVAPFLASLIVAGFGTYEALEWANFGIGLAALLAIWIATSRKA
jgi:predicted MFS family arabinose efflux permease